MDNIPFVLLIVDCIVVLRSIHFVLSILLLSQCQFRFVDLHPSLHSVDYTVILVWCQTQSWTSWCFASCQRVSDSTFDIMSITVNVRILGQGGSSSSAHCSKHSRGEDKPVMPINDILPE